MTIKLLPTISTNFLVTLFSYTQRMERVAALALQFGINLPPLGVGVTKDDPLLPALVTIAQQVEPEQRPCIIFTLGTEGEGSDIARLLAGAKPNILPYYLEWQQNGVPTGGIIANVYPERWIEVYNRRCLTPFDIYRPAIVPFLVQVEDSTSSTSSPPRTELDALILGPDWLQRFTPATLRYQQHLLDELLREQAEDKRIPITYYPTVSVPGLDAMFYAMLRVMNPLLPHDRLLSFLRSLPSQTLVDLGRRFWSTGPTLGQHRLVYG